MDFVEVTHARKNKLKKLPFSFVFLSLNRNIDFVEVTHARKNKLKKLPFFLCFSLA